MKRTLILPLVMILTALLSSCSSEKAKIKRALKSTIPVESVKGYNYKSHQIIETLLSDSVKDSILSYESSNLVKEMSIKRKLQTKKSYQESLDDCREKRQNTLYWLRGSYDGLIRDWQKMLDDVNEKIAKDSLEISHNNEKIAFFQQNLEKTESPIIFYKVRHEYQLNGTYHREDVMLDANYELIK